MVVVIGGVLALAALLALSRVVATGGGRGGPDLGPLAVGCGDRASAVVEQVRAVGRVLDDWPPRAVDGRCVALLDLDGTAADLGIRTAAALRDAGYRVDAVAPDPADGSVTITAAGSGGIAVVVHVAQDGRTTVRVTPG